MMTLSCGEFRARWDQRLDGGLAGADAAAFEEHRADCARCAADWASYSRTVSLVRSLPRAAAPAGFSSGVMARLVESDPAGPRRRFAFPFSARLAAGVLAAVTLGFLFSRISPLRDGVEGGFATPPASRPFGAPPAPEGAAKEVLAISPSSGEKNGLSGRGGDGLEAERGLPGVSKLGAPENKKKGLSDDLFVGEMAKSPSGDAPSRAEGDSEAGLVGKATESEADAAPRVTQGEFTEPLPESEALKAQMVRAAGEAKSEEGEEDAAAAGDAAYFARDAAGREVVLVPRPANFDQVLFLDPGTGRLADLRADLPEFHLANNMRPVPPLEANVDSSTDLFLGASALVESFALSNWSEPVPAGWQALPLGPAAPADAPVAVLDAGKKSEDSGDAALALDSGVAYRVYALDVEPDQVASRIGRLYGELSDAGAEPSGAAAPAATPAPDPAATGSTRKSVGGGRGSPPAPGAEARRGGASAPKAAAPAPGAAAVAGGGGGDAASEREKARAPIDKSARDDRRAEAPPSRSDDDESLDRRRDAGTRVRILVVVPVREPAPKADEKK